MTLLFGLFGLFALAAAACGDDSSPAATSSNSNAGEITVLAAASLTDAFKELGVAFQTANPATKVTFSFGASSTLVTQINQGAPADVFASADLANMDKLTGAGGAGAAGTPIAFATNKLQIIVGKGNPRGMAGPADLAKSGVVYVTAAPAVPIGKYAQQVLDKARVIVTPKSLEADVRAVVNKVTLGEADAGIVYATDVKAAGDKAAGVTIPDDVNVLATYPIAVIKATKNAPAANAFIAYVTSAPGQAILATFGFAKP